MFEMLLPQMPIPWLLLIADGLTSELLLFAGTCVTAFAALLGTVYSNRDVKRAIGNKNGRGSLHEIVDRIEDNVDEALSRAYENQHDLREVRRQINLLHYMVDSEIKEREREHPHSGIPGPRGKTTWFEADRADRRRR